LQGIGLVHSELVCGVAIAQAPTQVPVDLDDMQVIEARQQRRGQRPQTRTDFDDMIASLWIDGGDDALDHRRIGEKVLAESFPRNVPGSRHFGC
jgi:hypothetical protein